jgi:AAA+ superfamily predicted ATPase
MDATNRKDDLMGDMKRELKALLSGFDQIVERYTINTKAQIDEVIRALDGKNTEARVPGRKEIKRMVSLLQKLKIKPEKGRFKDLKKITETMDDIFTGFTSS